MKSIWILVFVSLLTVACNQPLKEQKTEFIEIRIRRWTGLEGGEVFVLRKIDKDWSAMLFGDGVRFSCHYQKSIQPKSGWENLWNSLQREGLLEIPDGKYEDKGWLDGNGFDADIFYRDKLTLYSFYVPDKIDSKEAKQIQNIGNIISNEFDTPIFKGNYSRNDVGDYLIENCKSFHAK